MIDWRKQKRAGKRIIRIKGELIVMNIVKLNGTHFDVGYQHGEQFAEAIQMFAEQRIGLCMDQSHTGHSLPRERVLALAEACVMEHEQYAPDLMDELRGMAQATGLSLAELVIVNGYTDMIDTVYADEDCTAFMIPNHLSRDGHGFYGQTWDMNVDAIPYVVLLHGEVPDKPAFLTFTVMGCVGMIGMNEAGIAVGINNLSARDGQIGVTWPFVVRRILEQTTLEDALACITEAKLAGAHHYMLLDSSGAGYSVEAMPTAYHIQPLADDSLIHTNHCLYAPTQHVERERPPESTSLIRLEQATTLLQQGAVDVQALMTLTRAEHVAATHPKPPFNVASCGAAIMQPGTGKFWAVQGLPTENAYQLFRI